MKRTIAGICLMVVAMAGIVGWELFGREKLLFTDILVLSEDVEPYSVIEKPMLTTKRVYQPNEKALKVEDYEKILGMEAIQFVPKGTELFSQYFSISTLSVNKNAGDYVFSLSTADIIAMPTSLSQGDTIYIYKGSKLITEAMVLRLRDANGNETFLSQNRNEAKSVICSIEIKLRQSQVKALSEALDQGERFIVAYN